MSHQRTLARFARAVEAICRHQQGHHGWSAAHRSIGHLLAEGFAVLDRLLVRTWAARPHISDPHLLTLLSVAIRDIALRDPAAATVFRDGTDTQTRAAALRNVLKRYENDLLHSLRDRSNSFTCARRFLIPQLIIGAFAANQNIPEVRLVDLGTGLGLLPRQLNNRVVFDRFSPDLTWRSAAPLYRSIPLVRRCGVDASPLPTLDWVHACHGNSPYYHDRYGELLWSLEQTRDAAKDVTLHALNMLDIRQMAEFLRTNRFNVATCNFALFQLDEPARRKIVDCVVSHLDRPGLFLTMDPSSGLSSPGARVNGYLAGDPTQLHLADATDAHFIGSATGGPQLPSVVGTAWSTGAH